MLVREYLVSRKRAEGDGRKVYRDCPQRCPKNKRKEYDVFRSDLCEVCPKRADLVRLKRATEAVWEKWLGEKVARGLRFNRYMKVLQQILSIKRYERDDTPFKVSLLIDVYSTEKSWFDDDNSK